MAALVGGRVQIRGPKEEGRGRQACHLAGGSQVRMQGCWPRGYSFIVIVALFVFVSRETPAFVHSRENTPGAVSRQRWPSSGTPKSLLSSVGCEYWRLQPPHE